MPALAGKVLAALGETAAIPPWPAQGLLADDLAGRPIDVIGPLVAKVTDDHVARLESRFGGTTTDQPFG